MKATAPLLAIGTLLLAACSTTTLDKDECLAVDWRTIGYEDGVAGRSGERIGLHRKACAEHGVTPDLEAYRAGRAEGLREFCQPHNGYRAGVNGVIYYDSCPDDLAPAFVAAYDSGRALYVREQRVRDADAALYSKRLEITRLEDRVARGAFQAISETATPEERTQGVLDTKQAAERMAGSRPRSRNSRRNAPDTRRNSTPTAPRSPRRPEPARRRLTDAHPQHHLARAPRHERGCNRRADLLEGIGFPDLGAEHPFDGQAPHGTQHAEQLER